MLGHVTMWLNHIDRLMQKRRNSIANTLELRLSCIKPSIWCENFCEINIRSMLVIVSPESHVPKPNLIYSKTNVSIQVSMS